MKNKFFSIKELKESLTNHSDDVPEILCGMAVDLLKVLQNIKNPTHKKESGFFSYKGFKININ